MTTKYLALVLALCGAGVAAQPAPDPTDAYWEQAVLYRDEWGVPHIYADNTRAMAFAFGYAQAGDHLEAMLLAYRIANGRAAEIKGEAYAASDELSIRLGHADLAYAAYQQTDAVTLDLCEGFAEGINAWIFEHPGEVPEWVQGVHPADVLALLHRYLLSMAPFDYPAASHLLPGTPSANAWAVAPSRSIDGHAMLVINPHAQFNSPFQWYEAHLVTKDLAIYGATLFGLPVILQGHNASLGWALSPNKPDIADIYVEYPVMDRARNPKSFMPVQISMRYGAIPYTHDVARAYYVKDGSGFLERSVAQQRTPRGPVVAMAEGWPLSWKVGGYYDFGALRQLFDMGRAENLSAFRAAVDRQQLSTFHVVYADREGNIWYQYNARAGRRPDVKRADWSYDASPEGVYREPLSTRDNVFEWGAPLAPADLPWLLNPAAGFVQACDTPPWLATTNSGVTEGNWPPWLVADVDSYRAKRVRRLLSMGPRSFTDMQAMLFDTLVPLAAEATPFLLRAAESHPRWLAEAHPDLIVGLEMLRDWNFLASTDSTAMTFFHLWWSVMRSNDDRTLLSDEGLHALFQENGPWIQEYALRSAAEAAKLLRNQYQTMNVPWGEVHTLRRGQREEPLPGSYSGGPIFAYEDRSYDRNKWEVSAGYGFAMAVRFGETPEAVSLVPFGTSEDPASKHYSDQMDLLLQKRFKIVRFNREEVEKYATSARGKSILLRAHDNRAAVTVEAETPVEARLVVSNRLNASMPPGTAPFTPYIEPIVRPAAARFSMIMEFSVPPEVCADAHLDKLGIYGYHPVVGWTYVDEQTIDYERRILSARAYESKVYAVLGAESLRLTSPGDAARTNTLVARVEEAPAQPPPGQAFESRGVTEVARNDDGGVLDISNDDRQRVSELFPRSPRVQERAAPRQKPFIRDRGVKAVMPALPPGWVPPRSWPAGFVPPPDLLPQTGGGASRGRFTPRARPVPPVAGNGLEARTPKLESDSESPLESETRVATRIPVRETPDGIFTNLPLQDPLPAVAPPEKERAPSKNERVVWSGRTPSELRGADWSSDSLELAPDPSRASPVRVGKELELRPPYDGALFNVSTTATVQAQVLQLEAPPEAFPPGLTAFSPVFEVLYNPRRVMGTTALTIGLGPGVCAQDRFGDLQLYAYDTATGWQPLFGQKSNPDARSLNALDLALRTYAILGPEDALLKAP